MADETRKSVEGILGDLSSLNSARQLFSELNYDTVRDTLSRQSWSKSAKEALAENPQVIATHGDFRIIYGKFASDKLLITPQRGVVNRLLREHPYALFVFSTEDEKSWHFVNVKLASKQDDEPNRDTKKRRLFRRITIRQNERRLRTAIDRVSMLDLAAIQPELFGIPPLTIQSQHDAAFDVEEVTKKFYEKYIKEIFRGLQGNLEQQTKDGKWAHDYALQFLNRVMFLYFVQRKGWLGDDDEFLEKLWNTYKRASQPEDTFFEKWLKVLFFEAFNNQKKLLNTNQRAYLPEEIRKALCDAPYLNGGLFKPDPKLDTRDDFEISDTQFGCILKFFQSYNFTISEDSPLDKEVAVDPEMIGKVYEGLVNVSETSTEWGEAGIFYTPRTEIDLMCRLSLVDNLANHLGERHKNLLYEVVFSLDQEEKDQADKALAEAKLWPDVEKRLNEITVLDPACGSGSFLVGMLYVLNDLLVRAEKQRGEPSNSYERKKRIIGQSLYGVDVMDWACHVAELRLWLALIVDAEFAKEELAIRKEPLLPHFSFKVRCGDSLVQEVGGVDMAHRRGVLELSQNMKRRLRELRNEKTKFYTNDASCKFKTVESLESQEVLIFRELLQDRVKTLDKQAKDLMREQAKESAEQQMLLTGELEERTKQLNLAHERREKQITALKEETKSLDVVLNSIRSRANVPFVWDISFAEIFSGDSHGFDIVIGNPPYVRQEKIADPKLSQEEITVENKKEYKAKLARSVYKEYPSFFQYKVATDKASHKISAKSDLYIYFYFHGLSLLSDKGSFCFITSNSWLDVGYGQDLQEFLLRRCHTKLVIDNKAKRSFKEADVNTIIVLFGAPADTKTSDEVSLEKTARFVMFYVPFEAVLHPVIFEEIHEATEKKPTEEYRVFPIRQVQLLTDGCEIPAETEKKKSRGPLIKVAKYIGNKWGGKYLRAPDIYWTIVEKGKDRILPLRKVAKYDYGVKPGCVKFFYISNETADAWKIEQRFLKPIITSSQSLRDIYIQANELLFYCHKNKRELAGTGALEYIKWGESQNFHKITSVRGHRPYWYSLHGEPIEFLLLQFWDKRFWTPIANAEMFCSNNFFYGKSLNADRDLLGALLNTTFHFLQIEILGRTNQAQGVLNTYGPDFFHLGVIKPTCVPRSTLIHAFNKVAKRSVLNIFDELKTSDRQALDNVIFDELGLTKGERNAIYEAMIDLVESRLRKAESLKG